MASDSPSNIIKQVDAQVNRILRQTDLNNVGLRARKAVDELRQDLVDAKKYAQDYELSETREEQITNAKKASNWLDKAHRAILKASEFNVFGPIDIAHISAQIDQVKAELK